MLMKAAPPPETYSTQSGLWTRASCGDADDEEYGNGVVVAAIEAPVTDIRMDDEVDARERVVGLNRRGSPSTVCGVGGPRYCPLLPAFSIAAARVHVLDKAYM